MKRFSLNFLHSMTPRPAVSPQRKQSGQESLRLLVLTALGILINCFPVCLFLHIHLVFGSVLSMFIVQYYGVTRATLATILIASPTFFLWNHPYAVIIMTLEVLCTGLLHKKTDIHLVLANALFWLCVGIPLIFFFYYTIMDFPSVTFIIMGKQTVNGLFNTLLASLLFLAYQLRQKKNRPSMRSLITVILAAFILLPSLTLLIIEGRKDFFTTEEQILFRLQHQATLVSQAVETWVGYHRDFTQKLAQTLHLMPQPQVRGLLADLMTSQTSFDYFFIQNTPSTYCTRTPRRAVPRIPLLPTSATTAVHCPRPAIPSPLQLQLVPGLVAPHDQSLLIFARSFTNRPEQEMIGGRIDLLHLKKLLRTLCSGSLSCLLLDHNNQVLFSTSDQEPSTLSPCARKPGFITKLRTELRQWTPQLPAPTPHIEEWRHASYFIHRSLNTELGWQIIMEQSLRSVHQALFLDNATKWFLVFTLVLIALSVAEWLGRRITTTAEAFNLLTHNLLESIHTAGLPATWPDSAIEERYQHIQTVKKMSEVIAAQFQQQQQRNQELEQRVAAKTRSLNTAKELYEKLTSHVPVAITLTDEQGSMLFANNYCCTLTMLPEERLLGTGWLSVLHPDDREQTLAFWDGIRESKQEICEVEFRCLTPAGIKWIHSSSIRFVNEDNQVCYIGCNIDLTPQKRIESALRESLDNFKNLIATTENLIVVTDLAGQVIFTNAAFEKILGYTPELAQALSLFDLYKAKDRHLAQDFYASMLKGQQQHCSLPLIDRQGRSLAAIAKAWRGQWNGTDCLFIFIKDLRGEEQSRQRFERLFHNNPALMAFSSLPERRFVDVNAAFLASTGYRKEEVIGKTSQELGMFAQPEQQDRVLQLIDELRCVPEQEITIRCQDGSLLEGLFSAEVITEHDRDYLLGVLVNTTEKRQAEQEKAMLASQYQQVLKTSMDGIHVVSPEGRIVEANQAFCDLLGYSREEMLSLYINELDQEVNATLIKQSFARLAQGPVKLEARHRHRDGHLLEVELYLHLFENNGQKLVWASSRDITQRKSTEEALRQSRAKAIAADKAKSKLLATLAHEFRTPLSLLQSSLDILDRYKGRLSDAQHQQQQQHLRNATRQLTLLVDTILTHNRMEMEEHKQEPTPVELATLCRSLIKQLTHVHAEQHQLEVYLAPSISTVQVDEMLFRRIFENLLTNAMHYTPAGRKIIVRADYLDQHLTLEVQDEGIGIAEEDLHHIFEPYYRGQNVGSRRGLGLGLGIVRDTLQQLGGTITIDSILNQGTLVKVMLPLQFP